ncbi:MAG: hypothetical protein U1A05_02320, partial [Alphaproteobacteria bacterium]|nr:hypothetical protein [Alphaproteobacteria bacterium]
LHTVQGASKHNAGKSRKIKPQQNQCEKCGLAAQGQPFQYHHDQHEHSKPHQEHAWSASGLILSHDGLTPKLLPPSKANNTIAWR